jgi:hypothetical protein
MSLKLSAPQPLAGMHLLNDFECGEHALDDWLKRRAMSNQHNGASRTFVVVDFAIKRIDFDRCENLGFYR